MELTQQLKDLKLSYLSNNLDSFLSSHSKSSARDVISRMAELELIDKAGRGTETRVHKAKLGAFKKMSEFDWAWTKNIDRATIEELLEGNFIKTSKNIIIAGAQGLGKTMLAKNLAWNAAIKGYSALFTSASKMVIELSSQESGAALQRCLNKYEHPKLLVIDEIGYLSFDNKSADYIFEIVNRRYEKGSIIMTTNLAFKDWHQVFPGAPCVTAMIDRLTHHSEIIKLTGESYRTKEASQTKNKNGVSK